MNSIIRLVTGFLVLNVYFNGTTHYINNSIIQFVLLLLFFPLAHVVARWAGMGGLQGLGLLRNRTGRTYFFVSFGLGFGFWGLMYVIYAVLGKFHIVGVKSGFPFLMSLFVMLIGYFLGSLINDVITRGYVIGGLSGKLPAIYVMMISILLYALDDFWNGEFTVLNFVFSLILGCSLTYAFHKTKAVWADTGLHFGLNCAYGLLYGLSGNYGDGVWVLAEGDINSVLNDVILLAVASLLFIPVYYYYRKRT